MEEETLKLILWLIFIAVWIVSAFAKKKRAGADPDAGESAGWPEQEGEDLFREEDESQDEIARILRTIAGVEEKPEAGEPKPEKKPAPPAPVIKKQPRQPLEERLPPREFTPAAKPAIVRGAAAARTGAAPAAGYLRGLDRDKLRGGVLLSEILAPPRALRPYRPAYFRRSLSP